MSAHTHTMPSWELPGHSPLCEHGLFRKTWTDAIAVLRAEELQLLESVKRTGADPANERSMRLMQIEHEIAMYEICIDRSHEQEERMRCVTDEKRATLRDRYFHLMASLGKAEIERLDGVAHTHFLSRNCPNTDAVVGENWISEIERAVRKIRHTLAI